MELQPLGQALQEISRSLAIRNGKPLPLPRNSAASPPNSAGFWSALPETAQARLTCRSCGGSGVTGPADDYQPACRECAGTGLRCPSCCGMTWLRRRDRLPQHHRVEELITRCPDCADVAAKHATVTRFIRSQLSEAAHV